MMWSEYVKQYVLSNKGGGKITWSNVVINIVNFNDGIGDTSLCVFVTNHTFNSTMYLENKVYYNYRYKKLQKERIILYFNFYISSIFMREF